MFILIEVFSHGTGISDGSFTYASLFRGTYSRFVHGSSFRILDIWHLKRSPRSLVTPMKYITPEMLPKAHWSLMESQSTKSMCEANLTKSPTLGSLMVRFNQGGSFGYWELWGPLEGSLINLI